ncbi:MAG: glycoside hydrolase family 3 C-terminal domain-containing protein [Bacilli bacterium]|nr:glycoside hydrolase family 3 C-terminal domain-containing protein [Bacilli bacterium]
MFKKLLLTLLISGLSAPVLAASEPTQLVTNDFIAKYTDRNSYIKAGSALNNRICDEGFTLLKNLDGFLPMEGVEKISVFGKSSTSLVYGGGGSGSGHVSGETQIDLQKSLTNVGFELNDALTSFYKDNSKSGSGRTNGNDGWKGNSEVTIGETPIEKYDATLKSTFSEYNDAAIMVLSREGSEGCDVLTIDATDSTKYGFSEKHALELSDNEQALFDMIKENFENIIILINSGNIFQCDKFENDDQVKGILWMGNPGATGASAVGRILCGDVNPSGHTVDTWTRDFSKDPTWQNFSDNRHTGEAIPNTSNRLKHASQDTMFNPDGTPVVSHGTLKTDPRYIEEAQKVVEGGLNGVKPSSYVSYEEGVYLDYRYYETRYQDMIKADGQKAADDWYESENGVIFPFGYGLSYTEFEQEIVGATVTNRTLESEKEEIRVKVKVTNTGSVPGKDVVQLYWKAPYISGEIEKADRVLCAFDKTDILEPNESAVYELTFALADVANYDYSDANKNNFKGYELDEGKYEISANKNAHEEFDSVKFNVKKGGIKFENDRFTGNKVENRFSGNDFYSSLPLENDIGFDHFSREDFDETFPTHPTIADRTLKEGSRVPEFYNHEFNLDDVEFDEEFLYVPAATKKTKEDIEALGWTQAETTLTKDQSIQFKEMVGLSLDDPKWEEFMNQMTYAEMLQFVTGGSSHNPAISRMDKPSSGDSDGPSQFQIIWWTGAPIVAATFNVELAKEQGEMVGTEAHLTGTYGWAGPACNLHRSPFGGRNFEYYSADAFLSGRMCGRVVAGATDLGMYCFFKHFAVNDQEKNREGVTVYLSEQTLRELYLKPFQMAVQEGKATGIMSSYNRLGLMETAASYPLLTEVLRNEWGFKGSIISDMTHRGNSSMNGKCYENINNRVLSGCNNQLDSQNYSDDCNAKWSKELHCPVYKSKTHGENTPSYSWWYAVRTCAKEAMWMCANSGAMKTALTPELDVTLTNVIDERLEAKVGDAINVEIVLPEEAEVGATLNGKVVAGVETSISAATPLPEGLKLEGNVISGTVNKEWNGFVHILFDVTFEGQSDPVRYGYSFELYVAKDKLVQEYVSGTGSNKGEANVGLIAGVAAGSVVVVAAAAVAVVLVMKKKKAAKAD